MIIYFKEYTPWRQISQRDMRPWYCCQFLNVITACYSQLTLYVEIVKKFTITSVKYKFSQIYINFLSFRHIFLCVIIYLLYVFSPCLPTNDEIKSSEVFVTDSGRSGNHFLFKNQDILTCSLIFPFCKRSISMIAKTRMPYSIIHQLGSKIVDCLFII